jgi:hypothetical protein
VHTGPKPQVGIEDVIFSQSNCTPFPPLNREKRRCDL